MSVDSQDRFRFLGGGLALSAAQFRSLDVHASGLLLFQLPAQLRAAHERETANPLYGDLAESVKLDERLNSASRRYSWRHQQDQNRERDEHSERERVAHVAI